MMKMTLQKRKRGCDGESEGMWRCYAAGFEDGEKGHALRKQRVLLKAGEGQAKDSLLKFQSLSFSSMKLISDCCPIELQKNNFVLFKCNLLQLEKAMAPHSSTLAWKIPWTGEPPGLPSMGSHRVGHDLSDLAAAAAAICCSSNWETNTASYSPNYYKLYKTKNRKKATRSHFPSVKT